MIKFFFGLNAVALGWGVYKSLKTKNEGLFYGILFAASLLIARYPFKMPFEFALSFMGFLGSGVLLYKWLHQKLNGNLIVFAMLFLVSGISFLMHGLLSSVRSHLWVVLDIGFGVCSLWGCWVFFNRILHYKLDRSLTIFGAILFVFGIVFLSQALFPPG